MKIRNLIIVVLVIAIIVLSVLLTLDQKKILDDNENVLNLQNKIENLEKELSDIKDDKTDLENKVRDLEEIDEHSLKITGKSNSSQNSFNNNGQAELSNGLGVVVYRQPSCDYFILENTSGYIVAEWMGGNYPDLGDKISGSFNSFGTQEFFNNTKDNDCSLWIDDYMLSKDEALDKVKEQCN